ncbi:MAG: hypothetical protein Kow0069_18520 [Promethearchaeota archaeon]
MLSCLILAGAVALAGFALAGRTSGSSAPLDPSSVRAHPPSAASFTTISERVEISRVRREVTVNQYGVVTVIDAYSLKNVGSSSLSSFVVLEPLPWTQNNTVYRQFWGGSGETCGFQLLPDLLNNFQQVLVHLSTPVAPGETGKVTHQRVLKDVVEVEGSRTTQEYVALLGVYPPAIETIKEATALVYTPPDSEVIAASPEASTQEATKLTYATTSVDAFEFQPLTVRISYLGASLLKFTSVVREVSVDTWGHVSVRETHRIENAGEVPVASFKLRVPEDASEVRVSDDLGGISGVTVASSPNSDGTKNVTVNLRDNRAQIEPHSLFYYVLEYVLPVDQVLQSSWFTHALQIDHYLTRADFLADTDTTRLVLQGSTKVLDVTPRPDRITTGEKGLVLEYDSSDVTFLENRRFDVLYEVDGYLVLARPLLLTLLVGALCTTYVVLRKGIKFGPKYELEEELAIPKRELREFVQVYEERNALFLEIEAAEEDLRRKKMRKREYARRVKEAQSKIKEIDRDLKPLRAKLMEADSRIVKVVERLDFLETERQSVKDSIRMLEQRYRRGGLQSRSSYDRLLEDLTSRVTKIQRNIDRSISELKGYLV